MHVDYRLLPTICLSLTIASSSVWAENENLVIEPEKVQKLMQRSKVLEGQIQVRQKNAQQRNDPSSKQYNIGYSDGYNKAVLDLLKSQLLTGVPQNTPDKHSPTISSNNSTNNTSVSNNNSNSANSAAAAAATSEPANAAGVSTLSSIVLPAAVIVPAAVIATTSAAPTTSSPTAMSPSATNPTAITDSASPAQIPVTSATATAINAPMPVSPKKSFSELLSLSMKSLELKKWSQAVSYASAALSIQPDSGTALINRSWGYAEQGLMHKALVDANESVRLLPNNALAYNNRAYTYELLEDLPRARQDYKMACSLRFNNACGIVAKIDQMTRDRPQKIALLMEQSHAKIQQKSWRELEDLSNQVILLDSNYTEALINRSWAYAEQGQLDKALTDASRAILLSPNNALAYNNRAYTYELRDNLVKATEDYIKACDLSYQAACDVVEKIKLLSARVAEKKVSPIEKLIIQSTEMYRKGNWHAVEQLSNKILALDPKNALAYVNRAGARTEMGLMYNALDDIDIAIRLNPKLGIAYNNKAYALERMGKIASATQEYKRACELGVQQSCQDYRRIDVRTTSRIR